MGDYGIFIWPCYIVTILSMALLGYVSWQNKVKSEKYVKELEDYIEELSPND
jgi:heme exporter protein CcmD